MQCICLIPNRNRPLRFAGIQGKAGCEDPQMRLQAADLFSQ